MYLQSKIVDSLGNNHEILYIEVPNETMLERVEKGLKNVYEQSKQIIIGLNEINKSKVASCKLVIMEISNQHSNNCFLADTEHFYPSN